MTYVVGFNDYCHLAWLLRSSRVSRSGVGWSCEAQRIPVESYSHDQKASQPDLDVKSAIKVSSNNQ